jgi:L-asparaginase II
VVRDPLVESTHGVAVAVADAAGRILFAAGPWERRTFWRSSAKPFQAMALVRRGGPAAFGLAEEALAVICASHAGTPRHVRQVAENLAAAGLGEEALLCGAHPPLDEPSARDLCERGLRPGPLHSNCSGKHSGMLLLARRLGAPTAAYVRPDHPAQRAILEEVVAFTGVAADALPRGIDGCSAPVFGLTVAEMARAYGRLVQPDGLGAERGAAARAVVRAMTAHPFLVAGPGRFDTDLMTETGGRLVSKSGADGVQCVGVPERGWGVAVKVLDGGGRAAAPAAMAVLSRLGLVSEAEVARLGRHVRPELRNVAGIPVGHIEAEIVWEVEAA